MSTQVIRLLLALCPIAVLTVPTASRAEEPTKRVVKTGIHGTIANFYTGGMPKSVGTTRPAERQEVQVYPEKGKQMLKEFKTDQRGEFTLALPAGKYRLETIAFKDNVVRRKNVTELVEVKEGALSEVKLKFIYHSR